MNCVKSAKETEVFLFFPQNLLCDIRTRIISLWWRAICEDIQDESIINRLNTQQIYKRYIFHYSLLIA